ncbi:MAG: PIN domain-containing protein [Acidobacteriota bacterium]
MPAVLVDAGPLIALIEPTDRHHERCVAALDTLSDALLTVWPAFTEAMYLLRGVERSQAALWGMIESGGLDFAELTPDDAAPMRVLMARYRDQPMDLADAALVRVAERDNLRRMFTLDRRHFEIYRIHRRGRFAILP